MEGVTQSSPFFRSGIKVQFKAGLSGSQFPNLTSDPLGLGVGDEGFMFYRSDLNQFRYWTGAAFVVFEASTGGDSLQTSYDGGNTIVTSGNLSVDISGS